MTWNDFVTTVGPPFIGLLSLVATAAIGIGVSYVKANWLNNVAQSAFANAAGGIVNKLGEELLKTVMTPGHPDVLIAVDKVKARIPDTVKSLGLTPINIAERIIDHIGKLQAPAIGAMIPPILHLPGSTMDASMKPSPAGPANFERPR